MMNSFKNIIIACALVLLITGLDSCKKFVEVDAPTTSINEANVYQSDATAIATLTGIYALMSNSQFVGSNGISVFSGLSGDELTLASVVTQNDLVAYYKNQLRTGPNGNYGTDLWGNCFYFFIFYCNAAIEGLNKSQSLTPSVKNQLLGEAKFLRALNYFYLVNFYGDAVLALTTNPNINETLPRSSTDKVYAQIVSDLKEAQNQLGSYFLDRTLLKETSERITPTKWVATALLARAYLYLGQYANAEAETSKIIANTGRFSLVPLNNVFLKNSLEAIWQLQPTQLSRNTQDGYTFLLSASGPNASESPVYLSPQLLSAFEAGDNRRKAGGWVDSVISGGATYFFPSKYKVKTSSGGLTEYQMMFRLGEQYLIRAEARAMQNNFRGSKDDLNTIRTRAGLPNTIANDQPSLLTAILKERQVELFTEMGQRWLDLKRMGKIDQVMTNVTPLKGNPDGWKSYQQLYPILYSDIQKNPNLVQNSGY